MALRSEQKIIIIRHLNQKLWSKSNYPANKEKYSLGGTLDDFHHFSNLVILKNCPRTKNTRQIQNDVKSRKSVQK